MQSKNDHYQAISCEMHSQYELAIMHKSKLKLSWLSEGELVSDTNILPLDVQTKNKAEYLLAVNAENKNLCIRLDHIRKMRILK